MNNKRTNYLVLILNIILIILFFSCQSGDFGNFITQSIMSNQEGITSFYGSSTIEFFIANASILFIISFTITTCCNVVSAIQNKENKKLCFWFSTLGVTTIAILIDGHNYKTLDILHFVDLIIFAIIPIIFALKNIIFIRQNKPHVIQIVSYILVIIIALLCLFDVLPFALDIYWGIVTQVMLFIYIHLQEKNIKESKAKKIVNIILYWFIQIIACIGLTILVLSASIINIVNHNKFEAQVSSIYSELLNTQHGTDFTKYFPIENNNKFGFINEDGQEKIPCEYDVVSYFFEVSYSYKREFFALARKGEEYYVLTKGNEAIHIEDNKYIKNIDNFIASTSISLRENSHTNRRLCTDLFYGFKNFS